MRLWRCSVCLNRHTVMLGRAYYQQVIEEYQPHLVFSVHDCLNRGYFQLARKILGEKVCDALPTAGSFPVAGAIASIGSSRPWIYIFRVLRRLEITRSRRAFHQSVLRYAAISCVRVHISRCSDPKKKRIFSTQAVRAKTRSVYRVLSNRWKWREQSLGAAATIGAPRG